MFYWTLDMEIVQRALQDSILNALQVFPSVYINGPRQAGKTTLVKTLLADDFKAQYLTFDDTLERAAATRNPLGYINAAGTVLSHLCIVFVKSAKLL